MGFFVGTITKSRERCCHKHNSSVTAELNGVPLYSPLWVACKPPAVALHEAVSLSGIHVWTGNNCCLCCQENGWLGVPVFSICPFFVFLLSKTTKMENNRRVIIVSLGDLDKEHSFGSQTSKAAFRTEAERSKCLLFPGTVIPLKVFPLVWLGWLACRGIVWS